MHSCRRRRYTDTWYFRKGLSLSGYQCEVAMSPTHALELFSQNVFDVVVADILLPWNEWFWTYDQSEENEAWHDNHHYEQGWLMIFPMMMPWTPGRQILSKNLLV